MRHLLLIFIVLSAWDVAAQRRHIEWATFPVERHSFEVEGDGGAYGTKGKFDGIGMLYFAPAKNLIRFTGFRAIKMGYLAQEPDDKFEMRCEEFETSSVISIGDGEFAFEAVVVGPFPRTVTGRLRIDVAPSGVAARVVEFKMDEHDDTYKGGHDSVYSA